MDVPCQRETKKELEKTKVNVEIPPCQACSSRSGRCALRMRAFTKSILQISTSPLWTSICALWSLVQEKCVLARDGDKFVCVSHIPRRPLRPAAPSHTLKLWGDIPDLEAAGGPKSLPPKIPGIPQDCLRPLESRWISWIQKILEWQSGFRASMCWHKT